MLHSGKDEMLYRLSGAQGGTKKEGRYVNAASILSFIHLSRSATFCSEYTHMLIYYKYITALWPVKAAPPYAYARAYFLKTFRTAMKKAYKSATSRSSGGRFRSAWRTDSVDSYEPFRLLKAMAHTHPWSW